MKPLAKDSVNLDRNMFDYLISIKQNFDNYANKSKNLSMALNIFQDCLERVDIDRVSMLDNIVKLIVTEVFSLVEVHSAYSESYNRVEVYSSIYRKKASVIETKSKYSEVEKVIESINKFKILTTLVTYKDDLGALQECFNILGIDFNVENLNIVVIQKYIDRLNTWYRSGNSSCILSE